MEIKENRIFISRMNFYMQMKMKTSEWKGKKTSATTQFFDLDLALSEARLYSQLSRSILSFTIACACVIYYKMICVCSSQCNVNLISVPSLILFFFAVAFSLSSRIT
jgi:hypothetical protein